MENEKYYLVRLLEAGQNMRDAQKNYFGSKSKESLIKSKQLEKEFDNMVFNLKQLININ